MKTEKATNLTITGLALAAVAAMCQSTSYAASGAGNGGGGVVKNGTYMTFYTAGLYVEPVDAESEGPPPLPALDRLISYVSGISYLSNYSKQALLGAIMPTTSRHYFSADPTLLTANIRQRLVAEFSRVTQIDASNLTLYALTDTSTQTTFLLPDFYKLGLDDQVSILFHESYWLLHPNTAYSNVVAAEMAFEAAMKDPGNLARTYDFTTYVGSNPDLRAEFTRWELGSGNLKGFLDQNNRFRMEQLLGTETLACYQRAVPDHQYWAAAYDECYSYFRLHLNTLLAQYPKSMLLRSLARHLDSPECLNDNETCQRRTRFSYFVKYNYYEHDISLVDLKKCSVDVSENYLGLSNCPDSSFNFKIDFGLSFDAI